LQQRWLLLVAADHASCLLLWHSRAACCRSCTVHAPDHVATRGVGGRQLQPRCCWCGALSADLLLLLLLLRAVEQHVLLPSSRLLLAELLSPLGQAIPAAARSLLEAAECLDLATLQATSSQHVVLHSNIGVVWYVAEEHYSCA
jgi:hypothetical protein